MRRPNKFIDPITGDEYAWPVNHSEEAPMVKTRQMGDGAPTSNIGLIPQQGAPGPLRLEWKGKIFTHAQLVAFLQWWNLCETQSIQVMDASGSVFEVVITEFQPQRVGVAQNRWDPANAPTWIWEYTLTMRVLKALHGEWWGVV